VVEIHARTMFEARIGEFEARHPREMSWAALPNH